MVSAEITLERALYIGSYFSGLLYGIHLTLYLISVYYLLVHPRPHSSKKKDNYFYIVFGAILLIFTAIAIAANAIFGQLMWIDKRDIPGGPQVFFAENTTWWVQIWGTSASLIPLFMADALLLYRCYIIQNSRVWIIIFPSLIYVAALVLGILATIESALPGEFLLRGKPAKFLLAFSVCTVVINIIVTTLICGRLFLVHRSIRNVFSSDSTRTYTGVAAILIESALPYTILGIASIILQFKNEPTAIALACVWGSFAPIASQLIILRVAMGIAWSEATLSQRLSTKLEFAVDGNTTQFGITTSGEAGPPTLRNEELNPSDRNLILS